MFSISEIPVGSWMTNAVGEGLGTGSIEDESRSHDFMGDISILDSTDW
jgi:hypothetical protein